MAEVEQTKPKIAENKPKNVKIRVFWANLKNRFNVLKVLVWYQRSYKKNFDFAMYDAQTLFDRTILGWTLNLSQWLFNTMITGWILWFLAYFFLRPSFPWFYFFPLGVLYWTLKKVRIELIGGKNVV